MKPMISTKNMIHSFSSFLHRSIAVRPTALCAATCANSLSRRLSAACLILVSLLLSLPMNARVWYGEAITNATSPSFYIYCEGIGFLGDQETNGSSFYDTHNGTAKWAFTCNTSGSTTIKSNKGKYIWMDRPPLSTTPGHADATASSTGTTKCEFTASQDGDLYKFTHKESGKTLGISWSTQTYYLNSSTTSLVGQYNQTNKWYIISERQAKAHISVSTNEITFGGIQYNGDYGVQYFTISYNEPVTLTITKTECVDAISVASVDSEEENYGNPTYTYTPKDTYGTVTIKVTYRTTTIGKLSDYAKLTISANGAIDKDKETITLDGEITPISYKAEWYIDQIINVGDVIEDFVTLPEDVKQAGATIKTVTASPAGLVSITKNAEGKWILTALGVGTVDLKVTADAIGNFASLNELKDPSVTITNLQKQYIRWEQSFKKLLLGVADIELTAKAVDAEGNPTGNPITYTLASNAPGIVAFTDATHTALTISGEGTTEITAKVAETATHVGNSMTLPIVVRDPNKTCEKPTYNASATLSKSTSIWAYSIPTPPESITINYSKKGSVTRNIVFSTSKDNGVTWTVVGQLSPNGSSYSASLGIDVTNVKLECPIASSTNKINVTKITITSAQYAKTLVDALDFKTTYNTTISNSVSVDWCNAVLHAEIEQTGTHFTLDEASYSQEAFGNCGEAGSQTIKVNYMPISGGTETAYLHIKDNDGTIYKTITLNGIPDKLPQTITWKALPASFNTTATIDLSNWGITASSGLTDFQYAITQGNGTVATLSGTKVSIITSGTLKISITQNGNDIYKSKTEEITLTIKKVTPTLRAGTALTTTPIVEGKELQTSTIGGAVYEDDLKSKVDGTFAWDFPTAKPTISGKTNVIFTPTNSAWYESVTIYDVPYTVLNKPTFSCPNTIDFGTASVIGGGSSTLTFSNLNDQGQTLTWHREFSGTDADYFTIDGAISNSGCTVRFNPQDATAHTATLTIWATYTAEGLTVESARQAISLTGTGSIPEAGLNYSLSTCNFGNVYGVKQASQEVGVHFVAVSEISETSFSWKNSNSNNIFRFTYTAGGTYDGKVAITAGVSTPVTATTVYEDVLVVKATKAIGGEEITAELPVQITLHPRQANTLALNIVEDGQNGIKAKYNSNGTFAYYYIYIDEIDQLLLKNRNNTTTPISFSLSTKFDTIATLDQNALTLSAVAKARTNHTITISQPQSEEYEAGSIAEFNFRVIKYTPVVTFREGVMEQRTDRTDGIWYYAWRNTEYTDFIRTTNHEVPLEIECQTNSHNDKYFKIDRKGDWSFNLVTFNTNADIRLRIKQKESATFEQLGSYVYGTSTTENLDYVISVIKDPRHVQILNPDSLMWKNTKPGLFGNIFTVSKTNAEYVGGQWNNTTKTWTGTAWTNGGNGYGSTTAFVIKDGGSVVFNFTGIPLRCYFAFRYPNNAASGGLFKVEESTDGVSWNTIGSNNSHGGRYYDMSGYSRYLRVSYDKGSTDKEWAMVYYMIIDEHLYVRANKNYVTCVQPENGKNYDPAKVTIKYANWGSGETKIHYACSNILFQIDEIQPTGRGIDEYEEKEISITYLGAKGTNATGTIVLKTDTAVTRSLKDSCVIVVQAIAAPLTTLTTENADNTGLQTGTTAGQRYEHNTTYQGSTYYFHKGLSDVKLHNCFDDSGNALFDKLYIFGITTPNNGSTVTTAYTNLDGSTTLVGTPCINTPTAGTTTANCFNASTICYVYLRSADGKSYTYSKSESFDATQKRFDHGSSLNGKKLYFTGYCPFAYMGTNPSEMGWMYFTGGNKDGVDIYLEDCEIMGRYKTASGCGNTKDYEYNEVEITIGENWLTTGCSSIFVFKSNQTASGIYTPKIHILGNNHLKGQAGSLISKVIGTVGPISVDAGINATGTASAPISILSDGNEGVTNLIFDDIWANNDTTNGFLKLDATSQQVGIADLGSTKGTLTFNGGQYNVRNSAADGQYTCNIMACYRAYTKTVAGQNITLYGLGADQPAGCIVTINSGTFTMTKNMQQISSKDYNGGDYYIDQENFMDLRLPGNSIVNGGTFNGINEVVRCTSTTSQGSRPVDGFNKYLCRYSYDPTTEGAVTYLSNGAISFSLPSIFAQKGVSGAYRSKQVSTNASDVNVSKGQVYGGQSINLDSNGKVNLMLHGIVSIDGNNPWCEELAQIVFEQWAACTPGATASSSGVNQSGGFTGKTTVKSDTIDGVVYKTNRLLYAEMDKNITNGSYKDGGISIQFNNEHGEIENEKDYTIHKELVSMVAVEADRWMAFVAPFDIYEVRIIEAADEDTLALKYSNNKAGALAYQATENICFSYKLANYVVKDLAGGRTTSMSFNDLAGMCIRNMAYDAQQSKYNRGYYTLDHYDGSNIMTANYYLYEIDNEKDTCIFPTNGTGTDLEIKWKPVAKKASAARADSSVLMKKGHVYAIQFPYCPMCNDVDTRTTYDYWTGKLIVFHGKGPQKVSGTNRQAAITSATAEAGKAVLTGNYTFANLNAPAGSIYAHNTKNDLFELTSSDTIIKPMQGYMLFSSPIANATALSISRAGRISYEYDSDITTDDHIPTIGSRASMLVYRTDNGFAVDPVRTQRVMLYNLNGQLLFNGTLTEGERHGFNLTQGIYLLKGEEEIIKVMVN